METNLPVTEEEAKNIIYHFYELMDKKPKRGNLTDFFNILSEDVVWRFKDFIFDGHQGFESHQEGKRKLFNETHDIKKITVRIKNNEAIVETFTIWSAETWSEPDTVSEFTKAEHRVTWKVNQCPNRKKPIITSHICTSIKILEGKIPDYLKDK